MLFCSRFRNHAPSRAFVLVFVFVIFGSNALTVETPAVFGQENVATVADAAAVSDLRKFPLPDDSDPNSTRRLASLLYYTASAPDIAFEYVKSKLKAAGWKELEGSYATQQFASGMFTQSAYQLSVSASQVTGDKNTVRTMISVTNHGNISLKDLPLPKGLETMFAGEVSAVYLASAPRQEIAKACRDALIAAGWQPYGEAGDQMFFKKNAVRLNAYVTVAPAQQNKTSITLGSELMSVDLPPPPDAKRNEYSESTTTLSFDSTQSSAQLFDYYKQLLAKSGWTATTENPISDRLNSSLIFRNDAKDMLTLEVQEVNDLRRGMLRHRSAAEVEEMERAFKEQRGKSSGSDK